MIQCERCHKKFTTQLALQHHHKFSKYPCDFLCKHCGECLGSRYKYEKHTEKKDCKPKTVQSAQPTVQVVHGPALNINGDNNGVVNQVVNQVLNQTFKVEIGEINTSYIQENGIIPHGLEGNQLLFQNANGLNRLLIKFSEQHPNKMYTDESLHELLIQIIQLLYSNEHFPQYINIIDNEPTKGHNKVYSGKEFIEDKMPKNARNGKITLSLIEMLNKFVTFGGIHPSIAKMVTAVFIPYIRKSIFNGNCNPSLQEAWRLNNQFIKKLKIKKLPANPKLLTEADIFTQYKEHNEKLQRLFNQYGKQYFEDIQHEYNRLENAYLSTFNALDPDADIVPLIEEPLDDDVRQIDVSAQEESNNSSDHVSDEEPSNNSPMPEERARTEFEQKRLEKIEDIKKSAGLSKARDLQA